MSNPLRDPRARDEDGLSLIELMIAMFILGVAVIALVGVASQSLISLRATRDREQATNAASSAIEAVRERDWTDIALPPDAAAPADLLSLAGCYESEPIVQNVVTDPVDFESTVGHNGKITVRTLVTWANGSCASGIPTDNKRIIAEARWEERGLVRTVRQETLVAPAARGLPVPDFELRPETKTLIVAGPGSEICGRHQLRNLGAKDTYDWELVRVVGDVNPPFKPEANGTGFKTPNGKWTVQAHFESPADGTRDVAPPSELPSGAKIMKELDGNKRPEAVDESNVPVYVDPKATANIWICWKAGTDVAEGDKFEAEIAVHSRFDGDRLETIVQTVRVGFTGEQWFLFDPLDSDEHDRGVNQQVQGQTVVVYPPYPMGPVVTVDGSAEKLGTIDYSDPTKSNWDRDVDEGDDPGVRLVRTAQDGREALEWHEQLVDQTTTLSGTMLLEIWVSTADVFDDEENDIPADNPHDMGLTITLERLNKNESTVEETLGTVVTGYQFAAGEGPWKKLSVSISLAAAPSFQRQQFLSLRVTCAATSDDDCVIAYDNVVYPSALTVVRQ